MALAKTFLILSLVGPICGTQSEVHDLLTGTYKEKPVMWGTIGTGLMELYRGPDDAWSIVITPPGCKAETVRCVCVQSWGNNLSINRDGIKDIFSNGL